RAGSEVVGKGAHVAVLAAMRAHFNDARIQAAGAAALLAFSKQLGARRRLLEDGALYVVVSALDRFGGVAGSSLPKHDPRAPLVLDAVESLGLLLNVRVQGVNLPVDAGEANRVVMRELLGVSSRARVRGGDPQADPFEVDLAIVATSSLYTLASFQKNAW